MHNWRKWPEEVRREIAEHELRRRLRTNPLQWIARPDGRIVPLTPTPLQVEAFGRAAKPGLKVFGFIGGNRLGKSVWGAMQAAQAMLGVPLESWPYQPLDPNEWRLGPATAGWCVTESSEMSRAGQQKFLWDRIPRALWRASWNKKSGFHNNVGMLSNGSTVTFKSREQDLKTFEMDVLDWVWVDETVPLMYVLACLPRLVDRRGRLWMTTIFNEPWLEDVFVHRKIDPASKRELPPESIDFVGGGMRDNPHLAAAEIDQLEAVLPPIERAYRIDGRPAFYVSLVYGEFDERQHLEQWGPPLARDWDRWEIVDPGWDNPCAVLFGGVDRFNVKHLYDEIYLRRRSVGQIAALIYLKRWTHLGLLGPREEAEYRAAAGLDEEEPPRAPDVQAARDQRLRGLIEQFRGRYGDRRPQGALIDMASRQQDQAKRISVREMFATFGLHFGPATNADKPAQEARVREWLMPIAGRAQFKVAYDATWARFEFAHYRKGAVDKLTGEFLDDKEKRIKAHNHLISCIEYWASAQPRWSGRAAPPPDWAVPKDATAKDWKRRG